MQNARCLRSLPPRGDWRLPRPAPAPPRRPGPARPVVPVLRRVPSRASFASRSASCRSRTWRARHVRRRGWWRHRGGAQDALRETLENRGALGNVRTSARRCRTPGGPRGRRAPISDETPSSTSSSASISAFPVPQHPQRLAPGERAAEVPVRPRARARDPREGERDPSPLQHHLANAEGEGDDASSHNVGHARAWETTTFTSGAHCDRAHMTSLLSRGTTRHLPPLG